MKRKKSGGSGANWMDTYGDMVTLLLCFFVLLFSMSTLDQQKMIQIVQAFNPDALKTEDPNQGVKGDNPDPTMGPEEEALEQEKVDSDIAKLYAALKRYSEEQNQQMSAQGLGGQGISVTMGSGYVFISLNDAVFFNGDSYVLLDSGKAVLDGVAAMIQPVSTSIDEFRVLGHTAQARADTPNNVSVDRILSANRSAVVLAYMQEKNILHPARMVSMGYGQWRPVAPNTSEERYKNRRVEIIVSGIQVGQTESDAIESYYTARKTENPAAASAPAPAN